MVMFSSFYITTATAFPQNPGTYAYFLKICNQPYIFTDGPSTGYHFWKYGGDCDDRAMVFANYLKSKGATNVQIYWVCLTDGNGTMLPINDGTMSGHAFVVWNGRVYSPSHPEDKRRYNADFKTYKQFLKKTYGFNTLYCNGHGPWDNQIGTPL